MRWYFSRSEQYAVAVLLIAIVFGVVVLALARERTRRDSETPAPFFEQVAEAKAAPVEVAPSKADSTEIAVHVAGAVQKTGVYRFFPGARVDDAIRAAGGARPDGCADALNLAAKLEDGERLYVPTRVEWTRMTGDQLPPLAVIASPDPRHAPEATGAIATPAISPRATSTAAASAVAAPASPAYAGPKPLPDGKISLNTANLERLDDLPGVGPVTAQRILDYRTQHGKFTDLAELLDVPGIGPKTYEKILPFATL